MPWIEQLRSVNWSEAGGIFLAGYALGCFTTGYYLVRMRGGHDIRDVGSGCVGARNVGRLLGRQGFLVTVLGDGGKGMATALGALLVYDFRLALAVALLFGTTFAALRQTVLPGLLALACLPLASWYLAQGPTAVAGTAALAGLVLVAHRQNLATEISDFLDRRTVHSRHDPPEL